MWKSSAELEAIFNRAWKQLDAGRPARGFEIFLAAAQRRHLSSQLMVGYLSDVGRGVRRSRVKAFHWYRKAARRGDAAAASNIGILYKEVGSFGRARWWPKKAVAMGAGDSLLELAQIELESGNEKAGLRYLRRLRKRTDTTEQAQALLARTTESERRVALRQK
jgi:TPR repeat protein